MTRIDLASAIAVFGSGDPQEGGREYRLARDVGRRIAELGYALVNGGYGGTMAASARGAVEAGGRVLGVTCTAWKSRANPYVTNEIRTDSLLQRMEVLIAEGRSGYVCLPGATGTLAELAHVWELLCKGILPRRPLVCVGEFWRPVADLMASTRDSSRGFLDFVEDAEGLGRHFPRSKRQCA